MSSRNRKKGFQPPRKVEEYWNLYKKGIYVEKPERRLPAWFIPMIALLLILAIIFWAAPTAFSRLQLAIGRSDQDPDEVKLLYGPEIWAVRKPVADVFLQDDLKSNRITQVLYNEPVTVSDQETQWGFYKVRLQDGMSGFMLADDLADSRASLEPANAQHKVVVITSSKRIMSHARSGTMLAEVMMGTQLFADYRGDGILRVRMPDGQFGWMSEDGLVVMNPDEQIKAAPDGARYFCSSVMAFHHVTVLEEGQSMAGVSMAGAVRIAALVNGVQLPRRLAAQSYAGEDVTFLRTTQESGSHDTEADTDATDGNDVGSDNDSLSSDEETDGSDNVPSTTANVPDLTLLQPGDLVFVDDAANPGQPVDMAIVMENGQFLMAPSSKTSIELVDPDRIPDWTSRIIRVRRLFAS